MPFSTIVEDALALDTPSAPGGEIVAIPSLSGKLVLAPDGDVEATSESPQAQTSEWIAADTTLSLDEVR